MLKLCYPQPTSQDADVKVNIKRKKSGKRRRPGTGKADDPAVPINLMTIDSGSKDQDAEGRTRSKVGIYSDTRDKTLSSPFFLVVTWL